MMKRLTLATAFLLILSSQTELFSLAAVQGPAQQPQSNMQDMMKMHEQMMADMKAADAKLEGLVKEMNAATGNAKINAVAVVINEFVRQQKAMHERMGQMHQHMMAGAGMMMKK